MKLGDALVYLATEDSGLKKGFDAAKEHTNSWANDIGSAAKTALTGVALGAATALAVGVATIGKAAFDVSNDVRTASADIAASLGIPIEAAREFGEVAKQVYGNNFGDSVTDVGDAVAIVAKQLKLAADDPALKTMTENAFRLRDVFGVDVSESIDAVKTLMTNFGVSSEEAFDLLAAGYQKGLDRSGDLLDTVGEYSTQFANVGFDADKFFSILEAGSQGGVLGTDKIGDGIKEMGIRLNEGGKDVHKAFETIGLDFDRIAKSVRAGDEAWADYFPNIIAGLQNIEDPIARSQAQVAIFGTQAEDLGTNFADTFNVSGSYVNKFGETIETVTLDSMNNFANVEGSITSLDAKYATFGSAVEGIWRKLVVSVSPFTDKLLELVNDAMPAVMGAFDRFDATVPPTMERGKAVIDTVINFTKNLFGGFRESADNNLTGPMLYWKDWLDQNMPRIQLIISTVLAWIQTFWAGWGEQILTVIHNTFDVAWVIIDTTMRNIGDLITLVLQLITGDWEGAGETLRGIVERQWETLVIVVSTQLDSLRTLFTNVDWAGAGSSIVTLLWSGIQGAWEWGVAEPFRRKLDALRALLPFSEPKDPTSPLRGLRKAGEATVGMIREGMDAQLDRMSTGLSGGLAGLIAGGGQPTAAAANGPISIVINLNGPATYEGGRAMGRGVTDELRQRGLA